MNKPYDSGNSRRLTGGARFGPLLLAVLLPLIQLAPVAAQVYSQSSPQPSLPAPESLVNGGQSRPTPQGQPQATPLSSKANLPIENLSAGQINAILKAGVGTLFIGASNVTGDLIIPRGSTLITDVSKNSTLNIQGNLLDSGKLLFNSSNSSTLAATLNAHNITVGPGALLASLNNLSLNINAKFNIVNAGTISSAGNLNMVAGGTITNALPAGVRAAMPVIEALNNINLISAGGAITNAGLINSIGGNVNIAAATASQAASLANIFGGGAASTVSDLLLNGTKGTIKALNDISISAAEGNLTLKGGSFLSQQLNLIALKDIEANVGEIRGTVNADACNTHVFANSANLRIGTWNVSADPVFANTGNVFLSALATGGAPIVAVAGQDILWTNGGTDLLDTTGASAGGNIYMVAGAKFAQAGAGDITISGPSGTGGKIDFTGSTFSGIDTSPAVTGNAGNVEMSAFKGSAAGSGTIKMPAGSTIDTQAAGVGSSGHIFAIAGASTGSAASPSIDLPTLSSNGGTGVGSSGLSGGHVIIQTTQPNVSSKNPMIIDPVSGSIRQGGILGGPIANSPVKIASISTGGGQVYVLSGMGIDITGQVNTKGLVDRPGGAVNLLAGASAKNPSSSDINVLGIGTGGPSGFPSGKVNILSPSNITVTNNIDTGADSSSSGTVFVAAGTPATQGNISINKIITRAAGASAASAAPIVVLSAGGCQTCPSHGAISITDLDSRNQSDAGDGAPITISSTGPVSVTGSILSMSTATNGGNGGSVFIASGLAAGTGINASMIETDANLAGNQAGGIYLISSSGITAPVIIQTQTGAPVPNFVNAPNFVSTQKSIAGNEGSVDVVFNGLSASTTFNPGGYTSVSDQVGTSKGATALDLEVINDKNVIIPIVSLASTPMTLLGSATSYSGIRSDMSDSSSYLLFSPGGINIGSDNAFLTTKSSADVPLTVLASNAGNVTINNSNAFFRAITVGGAVTSNGTLSIASRGGLTLGQVVSGATPAKGNSISLDAIGFSDLTLNDSISAAAGVAFQPTGGGNIDQNLPSVIDASSLTIGNVNLVGAIGTPSDPIFPDVNRLTILSNPTLNGTGASISTVSNMIVSFKVGGTLQLTGNNPIVLDNSTGPNTANFFTVMQVGSIQALKAGTAIQTPNYLLQTTQAQGIGTKSIPITIANSKGSTAPIRLSAIAGPGSVFISSPSVNDLELIGATLTANELSISTAGNIIFSTPGITTTGAMTLNGKQGMYANGGAIVLNSAGALNLVAGKQGIGLGGNTLGTIGVQSTALNVNSAGSVLLLSSGNVTFAGASNAGKANKGNFTLLSGANNVSFANLATLTAPSVDFSGTGSFEQATAGQLTISSDNLSFRNLTVGGVNPIVIKGGKLIFNTPNSFSLISMNNLTMGLLSSASSISLELQKGNLAAAGSPSPYSFDTNDLTIKIDGAGNVGSSTDFIGFSTGFGGNPVDVKVQALKGNVFLAGAPDLATTTSVGLNIDSSSATGTFTLSTTSPLEFDSSAGPAITASKSVSVSAKGDMTTVGALANIVSPAVTLKGVGASSLIKLANFGSSTAPVNLTLQQTADTSIQVPSVKLVGASTASNAADITITTTAGGIEIGSGATFKANDGSATSIDLTSATNITQAAKGTTLFASIINLDATGPAGFVGTSSVGIGTSSGTPSGILLVPHALGNVFITNEGPVDLFPLVSPAAQNFSLTTTGAAGFATISVALPLNAKNVTLQSSSGINLDDNITVTTSATLKVGGRSSIAGPGVVTAPDLVLTANTGNIGLSSLPLTTVVSGSISANVLAGRDGDVNIDNTGANVVLKSSSAGGSFTFQNLGSLTVNSIVTRSPLNISGGSISVTASGANLNINPGSKISAVGGSIQIHNANAGGNIVIGAGTKINTLATEKPAGGGSIAIFVGTPGSVTLGQALPAGLSIGTQTASPSSVYSLGQGLGSCVLVNGSGNVLNLIGQSIIFDTGVGQPQLITLQGGVVITADPIDLSKVNLPATSAAASYASSSAAVARPGSGFAIPVSAIPAPITQSVGTILPAPTNLPRSSSAISVDLCAPASSRHLSRRAAGAPALFDPVAHLTGDLVYNSGNAQIRRAESGDMIIFCDDAAKYEMESGALKLLSGKILLLPKSKVRLNMGNTQCTLERGCALLAGLEDACAELINLTDAGSGQIRVKHASSGEIGLDFGKLLVLGNLDSYSINVPSRNLQQNKNLLSAEVSLPYILSTPLARALASSPSARDRQNFKQVLKSCAAFSILNNKLPYKASAK